MVKDNWLTLNEYSKKYDLSISTLRRRIKNDEARHIFEEGKYFLFDEAMVKHKSVLPAKANNESTSTHQSVSEATPKTSSTNEPVMSTAQEILKELKKAYMVILQEKEEQISVLKNEVADLQTLVRVLESENERLRRVDFVAPNFDKPLVDL